VRDPWFAVRSMLVCVLCECRLYVIGTLPQLKSLDGDKVTQSERIRSSQDMSEMHEQLLRELTEDGIDVQAAMAYDDAMDELSEDEDDDGDAGATEGGGDEKKGSWTVKQRLKDHRDDMKKKRLEEEQKRKNNDSLLNTAQKTLPRRTKFDPLPGDADFVEDKIVEIREGSGASMADGENGHDDDDDNPHYFQKNEGKYEFTLLENDEGTALVLDVAVPRFMDTSLIDVDVRPKLVRCLIKGRLLQLRLQSEVFCDKSCAQRYAKSSP